MLGVFVPSPSRDGEKYSDYLTWAASAGLSGGKGLRVLVCILAGGLAKGRRRCSGQT